MRIALLILACLIMSSINAKEDAVRNLLSQWDFNDPESTEQKFLPMLAQNNTSSFEAALLSQIARTHSLRRNFDTAHEYLDRADAIQGEISAESAVLVALERGRAFNSDSQQTDALPHFRRAFEISDAHQLDALAVDAAHMIAIAETGQRAERWNLIAMAIAETSEDPDATKWLGSLYNNLGWTYFDAGETEKALVLFEKGVTFRKQHNQTRAWQIARWTVARAWREQGRTDKALEEQERLLQEVADDQGQLGYIHEELGELLLLNQDEASKTHFSKAFQILSQDGWLVANEPDRLARLKNLGKIDD
jgi:tetratricopeptide (TPR) repeat protein